MSKLTTWIKNQNPHAAKGMTAVKDVDCLHISTNPRLGKISPRVGNRQMKTEDRTIPRICCAETLLGCIYGHSAVRSVSNTQRDFNGDEWVDSTMPLFHIYRFNVEEVVRPSKKLVPDAVRTKELWIVPHSPETCLVNPERMGQMLMKQSLDIHVGKTRFMKNTFVLRVIVPFTLDDEVLQPGCYQFDLHGNLSLEHGGTQSKVEKLKSITLAEYLNVVKSYGSQ